MVGANLAVALRIARSGNPTIGVQIASFLAMTASQTHQQREIALLRSSQRLWGTDLFRRRTPRLYTRSRTSFVACRTSVKQLPQGEHCFVQFVDNVKYAKV
jgi:hypothetical protein